MGRAADRFDTSFLAGCERYPLVIFLHGHCRGDVDHYKRWLRLPYEVARSGYVVVVPELRAIAGGSYPWASGATAHAEGVLAWMRREWEHRDYLIPPPGTAVVGHSYGALLGARLVTRIQASAYVGLSGGWLEWPTTEPLPLGNLNVPSLFAWGSGGEDLYAELDHGPVKQVFWDPIKPPKHKLVFAGADHWDYLYSVQLPCRSGKGPCSLVPRLAADYTALFLSRYVPPEGAGIDGLIPETLIPPPVERTALQDLLASWHLGGLNRLPAYPECSVTHAFEMPTLRFKPTSISFGSVPVNDVRIRPLAIENLTGIDVAVTFPPSPALPPAQEGPSTGKDSPA